MTRLVLLDRRTLTGFVTFDPAITVDSPAWFAWAATQQEIALIEAGLYDEEGLGTILRVGGPAADQWVCLRSGRRGKQRTLPLGATDELTARRIIAAVEHLISIERDEDGMLTRQW